MKTRRCNCRARRSLNVPGRSRRDPFMHSYLKGEMNAHQNPTRMHLLLDQKPSKNDLPLFRLCTCLQDVLCPAPCDLLSGFLFSCFKEVIAFEHSSVLAEGLGPVEQRTKRLGLAFCDRFLAAKSNKNKIRVCERSELQPTKVHTLILLCSHA